MCKFTHRLFVFAIIYSASIQFLAEAAILSSKNKQKRDDLEDLLDIFTPDNDYDLHYDQRQKGEENLRIKLDGFFIGLPKLESSDVTMISDDFLEKLGEEFLLGLGKSRTTTIAPSNSLNYNRLDSLQRKPGAEQTKPEAIIVEIPAPKKDIEPLQRVESKSVEERKVGAGSKFKIGQLLSLLLKARRIGSLSTAEY